MKLKIGDNIEINGKKYTLYPSEDDTIASCLGCAFYEDNKRCSCPPSRESNVCFIIDCIFVEVND